MKKLSDVNFTRVLVVLLAAFAVIAWSWGFSDNTVEQEQTYSSESSGSATSECNCCGAADGGNLNVCDGEGQSLGFLVSHEANGNWTEVYVPEVNAIIKGSCSFRQANYVPDNEKIFFDDADCGASGGNAYVAVTLFSQNFNDINVLLLNVDGDAPRFFRVSDPTPCSTTFAQPLEPNGSPNIQSELDNQGDCVASSGPSLVFPVDEVTDDMPFTWPPVCPWRYSAS